MLLSDLSVRRPVFATVLSLVVVVLGIVGYSRLGVREFPDIDPPTVSIDTSYPGAAAAVVETRVTQILEDAVSGVEGVRTISSETSDGASQITIEFLLSRDIEGAANDVRDRVSRVLNQLPEEVDPPQIAKVDSNSDTIFWLNLASPVRDSGELTDYAERYLIDQLSTVPGVAQVRLGGGSRYAMRVWLDRQALAATGLTAGDVERALRAENVELPAGRVESEQREFTVRVERAYRTAADFERLAIGRGPDGYIVRLRDVARVDRGPSDDRVSFRRNGEDMVGLGILRQAKANTVEVVRAVKQRVVRMNESLPPDMQLYPSYDSSIYIDEAIDQVWWTLLMTAGVVVLVIFAFLGSVRATLVPAVTVPVSLVGTFFVLYLLGFSINLLTLLALVLAIGLVVDDSIVVLENIARRVRDGEAPLRAAFLGSRQVGFAVVATTVVLVAVFVPISLLQGNTGRLFSEFALALAGAVVLSTIVALTLSPAMCAAMLRSGAPTTISRWIDAGFRPMQRAYRWLLEGVVRQPFAALLVIGGLSAAIAGLYRVLPAEYTPSEDRGDFRVSVRGPEGASFTQSIEMATRVEDVLLDLIRSGEAERVLVRVPGSFGRGGDVNSAFGTVLLKLWGERDRTTQQVMAEVDEKFEAMPGYRAFCIARSGLLRRSGQAVQFVITGSTFEELARWRDVILARAAENPGLRAVDHDYKETKPQLQVLVDTDRAADLGVSVREIGSTLETLMGFRRVTTYVDRGEEYDVMLEAEDSDKRSPSDLEQVYVRSAVTGELVPLANLVRITPFADSSTRNRYDRLRAITITASLAEGYTLGEALEFLRGVVRDDLGNAPGIAYKEQSREFVEASGALVFTFGISLLLVYLVLAAQFESFLHPIVILLTVPLAVFGGLFGMWLAGETLNIYSQIALVILIGLATKNGILIVEFANQLRDEGRAILDAIVDASELRLRPILMTGFSTAFGAIPLVLATGAGAEARTAIGVVILSGVTLATLTTLFVVPSIYGFVARFTDSPGARARELETQLQTTSSAAEPVVG
ncbi:MAG: efflux RND transporter permease subunit [Planctomycetes bacterium]|nr:efflux RND transporter permease subunit [Planctomycetota bacterium]